METVKTLDLKPVVSVRQNIAAQASWIAIFAALTAVGAQIEIPHRPVPYTLQTFVVLLAGGMLGRRNGALSQLMYLAAGLLGLPVFSSGGFGLARLIGPTGGYLLSFPVAAFVVGYLLEGKPNYRRALVSMVVGAIVIFSLGTLQLFFVYFHDWEMAIANGFLIFSWWDLAKILGAAAIITQQAKRQGKETPQN